MIFFCVIASLYGDCMEPGCIGISNTHNLPGPTDVTENPYKEKTHFFKDATQKSASMVLCGIAIELVPWSPIFGKCSHLREKRKGADFLPRVYMVGCMVRNSHTDLKNRMVISRIAISKKSHRTTGPPSDLRPSS